MITCGDEQRTKRGLKTELESFYNAIVNDTQPSVTIIEGYKALDMAYKIINKIS